MSAESTAERIRKLERLAERPGTPGEGPAAQAAIDRIIGRLPIVGRTIERAKACSSCGSTKFKIEPGKGPHALSSLRQLWSRRVLDARRRNAEIRKRSG
jgi:hypothetical protein